jgi:hypothetical protein
MKAHARYSPSIVSGALNISPMDWQESRKSLLFYVGYAIAAIIVLVVLGALAYVALFGMPKTTTTAGTSGTLIDAITGKACELIPGTNEPVYIGCGDPGQGIVRMS